MNDSSSVAFLVYAGILRWRMRLLPKLTAVVLQERWMGSAHCFCVKSLGESSAEEHEGELVQLTELSRPVLDVLSLQSLEVYPVRLVPSGYFHDVCFCIG